MIAIPLVLSLLVAWLIGLGVLRLLWPASVPFSRYRPAAGALGLGTGLGISSVATFLWMLASGPSRGFVAAELVLLAVMGVLLSRRRGTDGPKAAGLPAARPWEARVLRGAFIAGIACALAGFAAFWITAPHGGWDAWMDWNLRARLIFRSGDHWRDAFSGLIPWSHPDYPVLVPGSVVREWIYAGAEHPAASALLALGFTFATVGLTSGALAVFRRAEQAALAAVILLATPFFVSHGASQFADVPVGFFFLGTIVLLRLQDRYAGQTRRFAALAGLTAGLAMWTKNEGLLFLVSIVAAQVLTGLGRDRRKRLLPQLAAFGAGAIPFLLLVGWFKLTLAPPNDLVSNAGAGQALGWLTDPHRYAVTVAAFARHILGFGNNGLVSAVWLMVGYALCVGVRVPPEDRAWMLTTVLAIGIMLVGHFLVFVVGTPDVARLLDSSLDRLLLQLWPSALLAYFMAVRAALPRLRHQQRLEEPVLELHPGGQPVAADPDLLR